MTKGADIRADATLMMEPYNNWEEKIMPAPFTIALLGQLVIISSTVDFKLKAPKDGFKLVEWPDSFRASLAQVTGEGYKAFNIAHQCMDEIRLTTSQVPGHLVSAVKLLAGGSDYEVKNTLPIVLQNIEDIASSCKERSEEVAAKFKMVMNLVLELQQSCVATHSASERQLEDIKTQIEVQKIKENDLKNQKAMYKEQYERIDKEVKKCSNNYDKAIKDIPGAGELIGLTLLDTVTSVVSSVSSLFSFGKGQKSDSTPKGKKGSSSGRSVSRSTSYEDNTLYGYAKNLHSNVQNMNDYFEDDAQSLVELSSKDQSTKLRFHEYFFVNQKADVRQVNGNSDLKKRINDICDECLKICKALKEQYEKGELSNADHIYKKFEKVSDAENSLYAECCQALQVNPMAGGTPNVDKKSSHDASRSMTEQRIKNAHFKVEAATQRLEQVEKQFETASDSMRKNNEEMTKALVEMTRFEAEKATHGDIIDMLQKGIKKLGLLQEQWAQLSMFFEHIATLIKSSLNSQLTTFVKYSDSASQQQLETGVKMSDVMRDAIYQTVFEAVKYSSLVNHLSTGYFEVSDKYLMESISRLGKLLALDDENAKKREQRALTDSCEETQRAIKNLISNHNKDFKRRVQSRIASIKNEFEEALPPLSQDAAQKVKLSAAEGINGAPTRCLLYTSPSPRDATLSRMPSSA